MQAAAGRGGDPITQHPPRHPAPTPAPGRAHSLSSEPRKATRVCRHESMRRKCLNSGFTCLFGGGVSSATLRHRRGGQAGPPARPAPSGAAPPAPGCSARAPTRLLARYRGATDELMTPAAPGHPQGPHLLVPSRESLTPQDPPTPLGTPVPPHSLELHGLHQLVQFEDLILQVVVEGRVLHDEQVELLVGGEWGSGRGAAGGLGAGGAAGWAPTLITFPALSSSCSSPL